MRVCLRLGVFIYITFTRKSIFIYMYKHEHNKMWIFRRISDGIILPNNLTNTKLFNDDKTYMCVFCVRVGAHI